MNVFPNDSTVRVASIVKDFLLVLSFIIALGGLLIAVFQYRYSKLHHRKMLKDMESLQKAEDQLHELQRELDKAKFEHDLAARNEMIGLEDKLRAEKNASNDHHANTLSTLSHKDSEFSYFRQRSVPDISDFNRLYELEEELRQTREQLNRAETALANKSWAPPHQLQLWLQLTHELELNHYNAKRQAAEAQLVAAKEGCEKLKKKRSSFFGSLRVAHGTSIDDVDNRILQAKQALSEITRDLKERLYRWQQIEILCGFPIVHNKGLAHIQSELYANYSKGSPTSNELSNLHRTPSDTCLAEPENEAFTYNKSPSFNRSSFHQRSNRSNHSPDAGSIISSSMSNSTHHHHQQQHHSRIQSYNGFTEFNGAQDSHSDNESKDSDNDTGGYSRSAHYPVFTLGEGTLSPEYAEATSASLLGSTHRRTWSSIRRAPSRNRSGESDTRIRRHSPEPMVKSYSLNTTATGFMDQESGSVDRRSPRVSYGDTTEIEDNQSQNFDDLSGPRDDPQPQTAHPVGKQSDGLSNKQQNVPEHYKNQQEKPKDATTTSESQAKSLPNKNGSTSSGGSKPIKRSISLYIKGARRSLNFLGDRRKISVPAENIHLENDSRRSQ